MKNLKIMAIVLIAIIFSSSILSGCNIMWKVDAEDIYNKYIEIANKYRVTEIVNGEEQTNLSKSLFNSSNNIKITYDEESSLLYEIERRSQSLSEANKNKAIFSVFGEEYPNILYTSMLFFNKYRAALLVEDINWDEDDLEVIYDNLLSFESAIYKFDKTKATLENASSFDYTGDVEEPYTLTVMVKYNSFKKAYNNLIKSSINLSKAYENAFIKAVAIPEQYSNSAQIPYIEIRRIIYSSSLYLTQATYEYYLEYKDSFIDVNDNLYSQMLLINETINDMIFSDEGLTDETNTDYYKTLRTYEEQIKVQDSSYVKMIDKFNAIKNSTNKEDLSLKASIEEVIDELSAHYNNYSSFVFEMANKITLNDN